MKYVLSIQDKKEKSRIWKFADLHGLRRNQHENY